MTKEMQEFLQSIDLFQISIAIGIFFYILRVVFKTFLPSVALMNKIVESVKDLPEDLPKLKKDVGIVKENVKELSSELPTLREELQEAKEKVREIENRLNQLVNAHILPTEEEIA